MQSRPAAVAAANPRTVVVIQAGSAVICSEWDAEAAAIVQPFYGGEQAGHGVGAVVGATQIVNNGSDGERFDVVIIGSGTGGGTVAHSLAGGAQTQSSSVEEVSASVEELTASIDGMASASNVTSICQIRRALDAPFMTAARSSRNSLYSGSCS